jgi:hypothetical protein
VVLINPDGNTQTFSFFENQTDIIPKTIAIISMMSIGFIQQIKIEKIIKKLN